MLKTRLTEMLGIELPIMQGGMQRVSTAELVAAVANAGALGFLSALTQPTPEALARDRTNPVDDGQALRGESDDPAEPDAAALRGVRTGHRRLRGQDRRDRRLQPGAVHADVQRGGHQGDPQVHRHQAREEGAGAWAVRRSIIDGFEAAGHPGEDGIGSLVLCRGPSMSSTCR